MFTLLHYLADWVGGSKPCGTLTASQGGGLASKPGVECIGAKALQAGAQVCARMCVCVRVVRSEHGFVGTFI